MAAGFRVDEIPDLVLYGPVGCDACSQTGFVGRLGVFEIMEFDDELTRLFLTTPQPRSSGKWRFARACTPIAATRSTRSRPVSRR